MLKKLLIAGGVLVLLGAIAGGVGYWMVYGTNTNPYDGVKTVKIPPDVSFEVVMDSLDAGGILKRRGTLSTVANLTGWNEQVKPGHYEIEAGASNYDMLDKIRKGLQTPVRITVPPGSRPEVVAEALAKQMYFEKEDFLAAINDAGLAASLGTDTLHLFSYMLPETYFVYWLSDATSVVSKIKKEFDDKFTPAMKAGADSLDLTIDEVLRVASIVEWETQHVPEKPTIAGVYLNRLQQRWRLDADPTVQYALLEIEGKRRRLFFRDYKIKHPYNTYQFRGLPPGPVTNPSFSSVEAVVKPEKHNYMFFVALGDGSHSFTRTLREHINASREFHKLMRERRRKAAEEEKAQQLTEEAGG